jgi:hypothetical protein
MSDRASHTSSRTQIARKVVTLQPHPCPAKTCNLGYIFFLAKAKPPALAFKKPITQVIGFLDRAQPGGRKTY